RFIFNLNKFWCTGEDSNLRSAFLQGRRTSCSALACVARSFGARTRLTLRTQLNWCTGEDSNLRSSKERQTYSLLPLTTRPPVQTLKLELMIGIKKQNR